jgi:nucleoside-diphosphate-sugar epimerase
MKSNECRVACFLLIQMYTGTDRLFCQSFLLGNAQGKFEETKFRSRGVATFESFPSIRSVPPQLNSAVEAGDTILVIGGTGGVGQLATRKILRSEKGYKVKVTTRDTARAEATLEVPEARFVAVDLVEGSDIDLVTAMNDVSAIVVSVGTTAFPTMKWAGGNTPKAIDEEAVKKIARIASTVKSLKKIVLVTSVGVSRTNEMPFLILNLFGVLDAKRSGEEAIKAAATQAGFGYVIIRPGRLVGGPYTNEDLAKLFQIEGSEANGVDIALGDSLLGDCKRDACAEAIVQCLENENCVNIDFSIVSNPNKSSMTNAEWRTAFGKL